MNRFNKIVEALHESVPRLVLVVLAMSVVSPVIEAQPCALVTNFGSGDISLIDTETNAIVGTIPVATSLNGIAITPDGSTGYVANGTGGVSVVDLASRSVITTIALGLDPTHQSGLAITPNGARVYVPLRFGVAVIDTATNSLMTTVPISSINPPNVAVSPNGAFAYVAGADGSNNVTVIATASSTVVGTFLTGAGPTTPYGIAFTPNGATAYVTNNSSEAMNVAVIDTVDNSLVTSISLDGRPTGIGMSPDGSLAYVLNGGFPADPAEEAPFEVSVIDTATNTVVATIPLGGLAYEVGITPDGAHAYVPNFGLNSIAAIATATNTVLATIPGGTNPFGVAIRPGLCPGITVVIGGCDSGVPNLPVPGGGTISDRISQCAAGAKNHGAFVSCTSHVTNDLKKAGIVTGAQKGAIQSCASNADIP